VSNNDHARKNAYAYARAGACTVIEEDNITPHLVHVELDRIVKDRRLYDSMSRSARAFYTPTSSRIIAKELITLAFRS